MAKSKSHPLDSLTFKAPKLDEIPPATAAINTTAQTVSVGAPAPATAAEQPTTLEEEMRSSNVTLPVKMWEWIDAKHAEARRKGGKPLRKAAIIRAVFEVAMAADVDLAGTQSEKEIAERISRAIRQ